MTGADGGAAGMVDLASRQLGGSVQFATDELFADKENLVKPGAARWQPDEFGNKGKVYDGWETRRRRQPGHDHAIIRLGAAGIVHEVVVDTAHFRGNYPPEVSVEAVAAAGYPSPAELAAFGWTTLVPRTAAVGDSANRYPVTDPHRWTHLRLSIYPDGGVARFRAHGRVVPDPAFLTGTIDLAAAENGGEVTGWSNAFYASAANLVLPGLARAMNEGWENARRRDGDRDYVEVALAGPGRIRRVEIDTTHFVGNAPGWVELRAVGPAGRPGEQGDWREILPRTPVQPDTRHRFLPADGDPAARVRLDVIPDGGLARLRVHGELTPEGLATLRQRFTDSLPHPRSR